MFCPEGYVSLHDANREAEILAATWLSDPQNNKTGKGRVSSLQYSAWQNWVDAYRTWIILVFVNRSWRHFLLASPSGRLMRVSNLVFHGAGHVAIAGQEEFTIESIDDFPDRDKDAGKWFPFFDERNGLIRAPIESRFHSFSADELGAIANFEGWAICWKPKNFANWHSEFQEILKSAPQEAPKMPQPLANERRAAYQIIDMYDKNDQITKAACQKQIDHELGTLAFNRAWQTAKAERPGLGMAGRPKSKPQIETPR